MDELLALCRSMLITYNSCHHFYLKYSKCYLCFGEEKYNWTSEIVNRTKPTKYSEAWRDIECTRIYRTKYWFQRWICLLRQSVIGSWHNRFIVWLKKRMQFQQMMMDIWISTWKRLKSDSDFIPYTKINPRTKNKS